MNPVIDILTSHRSVRKFSDRPVEESIFQTIARVWVRNNMKSFLEKREFFLK